MSLVLGTLLWSVRLRSQNSISRANGERRSQIEKHVVVSVRSNLPQKSSTVLSEPKFGPPQSNVPGSTPEQGVTSQTEISHKSSGSTSCRGGVMPGLGSRWEDTLLPWRSEFCHWAITFQNTNQTVWKQDQKTCFKLCTVGLTSLLHLEYKSSWSY